MSETVTMISTFAPLISLVVGPIAAYWIGSNRGFRKGVKSQANLITALQRQIKAERELTTALHEQTQAQDGLIAKLDEKIDLLTECAKANRQTIEAQAEHIHLLETAHT